MNIYSILQEISKINCIIDGNIIILDNIKIKLVDNSENYRNELYNDVKKCDTFIYHIFEWEWKTKYNKIINQIKNLINQNEYKIPARKCTIKQIESKEKNKFLEENHLQGADRCNIALGLYYEDILVALMTFTKPRFNLKYQWELSRFCCKANYNVIGGASKLFKYFINNYNPMNILSYSDIAKTRGTLYEKLGFVLDHISEPNYIWTNNIDVKTRYQCQKHKLKELNIKGSETDIMKELGYHKIYDCGNKVWIWKNNQNELNKKIEENDYYEEKIFDVSKLTRDYSIIPLKKMKINTPTGYTYEIPPKEDLEYLYNELNYSTQMIWEYFGVSRRIVQGWFKKLGIKKSQKLITKSIQRTNYKKYGSKTPLQNEIIKRKIFNTKLERYNDSGYNNRDKAKITVRKLYGCDNVNQIQIRDKLYILNNKDNFIKYIKDNNIINATDMSNKIGISEAVLARKIIKYELSYLFDNSRSVLEKTIYEKMLSFIPTIEHNVKPFKGNHSRKEIDIYDSIQQKGIEIDGTYWHGSLQYDDYYLKQQKKSMVALLNNISLYHVREIDYENNPNKVINELKRFLGLYNNEIKINECSVRNINFNDGMTFINEYSYDKKYGSVFLGIYYKNELVCVCGYTDNTIYNIIVKYDWNIIGLYEMLEKYISFNRLILNFSHYDIMSFLNKGLNINSITQPNTEIERGITISDCGEIILEK